jgi:hypothetical protein
MNRKIAWLFVFAAAFAAMTASAQTYDLDIVLSSFGTPLYNFEGSFNYNAGGTGLCSAPYCASGITPDFTNVNVSDPREGTAFTAITGSGSTLTFVDFEGGPANPMTSEIWTLSMTIGAPLGASSIGLSNILYAITPNVTGEYSCGGPSRLSTPGITCPVATLKIAPAPAPEIDASSAAAGFTFLFGVLAVMRGRQRVR